MGLVERARQAVANLHVVKCSHCGSSVDAREFSGHGCVRRAVSEELRAEYRQMLAHGDVGLGR